MSDILNFLLSYNGLFRVLLIVLITLLAMALSKRTINLFYKVVTKVLKHEIPQERINEFQQVLKPLTHLWIVLVFQITTYVLLIDSISSLSGITAKIASLLSAIPNSVIHLVLIGMFLTNILDFYIENHKDDQKEIKNLNATLLHMMFKVARVLIWVLIVCMVLSDLGYDVSAIFAGLGLGGVAIALAAQDTVSNLFGCVVVLLDKPFEINDWIQTPDVEGIVEEISFRSTRIRTFQNALVSVPNSTLASSLITNWTQMRKRKLRFYINLTYSTTEEQIKRIKEELVEYLHSLEIVDSESVMVHFEEMSSSSLDLRVDALILQPDLKTFLAVRETINFKVMDIVTSAGADFAFPSQSIYIEKQ
ncbi:MAG: mechanosensitive ion channel family protein [Erysipelotrichales bacterium]|nr:mechanosensitive ion channel family protein [Erysipelotrichales bacterium]